MEKELHLQITVKEGLLNRDVETFGKMDPFIRFEIGKQVQTSKVLEDAGKKPIWNESFDFLLTSNDILKFSVFDHEASAKDQLIGEGSIEVGQLSIGHTDTTANIYYKGKDVGDINFEIEVSESEKSQILAELSKERHEKSKLVDQIQKLNSELNDKANFIKKANAEIERQHALIKDLERSVELAQAKDPKDENNNKQLYLIQESIFKAKFEKSENDVKVLEEEVERKRKETELLKENIKKINATHKTEESKAPLIGGVVGGAILGLGLGFLLKIKK